MASVGIAITKSTSFRNSTQEFSNIYFYVGGTTPDSSGAGAMIDELTAAEKTFHSTAVTFVRGKLWTNTGNKATNEMINQKNLSGTGARAISSFLDKERAFLFKLRAGVDSRGNPVYLRKWFHACGVFISGQTLGQSLVENTNSFSQGDRDAMVAAMQSIGGLSSGGGLWKLAAKSGRLPTAGANWISHPYLEHHQLGDQWRST